MIIIFDFGSQSTHLIGRRLRELGADITILEPEHALDDINKLKPDGIVLSGGPSSVYEKNAPTIDKKIYELGLPILGICYGQQLTAHLLGGEVQPGKKKELGPAVVTVVKKSLLLSPQKDILIPTQFTAWMSHGDDVTSLPSGFTPVAKTDTIPFAAYEHSSKKICNIQFHPEVVHTQFGTEILKNFLILCGITPVKQTVNRHMVDDLISNIRDSVGGKKVIAALSGGVDSSVASVLVHKAIGNKLTAFYIDSGLMRLHETDVLESVFKKHFHMDVRIIRAEKIFLDALKGEADPEKKRKIIGKTFIDVFEKEAKKMDADFLMQGTIYPDVIESSGTKHAQKIKSHHNVGGLPEHMKLTLLEPLRNFYKDEVRLIGALVDLPNSVVQRQPFPGPGLATRIIGEVTKYKLDVLRRADAIVQEEIERAGLTQKLWQAFAVFTGIQTTGVRGDGRVYGETIGIRAVEATDAMSVTWAYLPHEVLDAISIRIVTEVKEVNRVVYDITNKPPGTIEWE